MTRGFLIVAQNNSTTDYIKCARLLAKNIKDKMPGEQVALLTDVSIDAPEFDQVITFPYSDQCTTDSWKLANDWQVYDASPYDRTIKLEADLYLPRNISHWWDILAERDLVISTTIRDYKNQVSKRRDYRKFIDDNLLPDTYNAITYFKKSDVAQQFFSLVRNLFENWQQYSPEFKGPKQEQPTTDFVYAVAASMIGVEQTTMPSFTEMSMIHMKPLITNTRTTDWSDELLLEITPDVVRINTIPQLSPIHYQVKTIADKFLKELYD